MQPGAFRGFCRQPIMYVWRMTLFLSHTRDGLVPNPEQREGRLPMPTPFSIYRYGSYKYGCTIVQNAVHLVVQILRLHATAERAVDDEVVNQHQGKTHARDSQHPSQCQIA